MRAVRRFLVALMAGSVLLAAAPALPAHALDQWTWYYTGENNYPVDTGTPGGTKGAIEVPVTQTVGFATQAGGTWTAPANAAMSTWDRLGGGMEFAHTNSTVVDFSPNTCDGSAAHPNAFHVGSAGGGGTLAYTWQCWGQAFRITSFQIVVDPGAANWNTNIAVNPASNQEDMWSAIAHELGHATGWSKFHYEGCSNWDGFGNCIGTLETSEPAVDCGATVDRGTMCATINPGDAGQRVLSNDDKITFYNAYPKPTNGTPIGGVPDICNFALDTGTFITPVTGSVVPIVCA
jgi:hypothetical protein